MSLRHKTQAILLEAVTQYTQDLEPEQQQALLHYLEEKGGVHLERAREAKFGDFASNIAMMLTKTLRKNPREIASALLERLPENELIQKTEIAGPGFINLYLHPDVYHQELKRILAEKNDYGRKEKTGSRILVEFVSANPTGPLHVGHGRHAAYGDCVSNLLEANGYEVHREYYVNDAGRQMQILAVSTWLRYQELAGEEFDFPSNAYKGEYIKTIAQTILNKFGDQYRVDRKQILSGLPADEPEGGDKEVFIDAMVARFKDLAGNDVFEIFLNTALNSILDDIKGDLHEFGVVHDEWFSEHKMVEDGLVDMTLEKLRESGKVYEQDGAEWFRSTDYGDEKDRVIVRDNGVKTYFAPDIAYHYSKYERGYRLLDILGSDHHGYIPRVSGALTALNVPDDYFEVRLMQFANLYRGKEKVQMSTRSGSFVTLRELREEVGNDAARLFYVMRSNEQHLDFDLELAKKKDNENPVYYLQYAHARISKVFRKVTEKGYIYDEELGRQHLALLDSDAAKLLLTILSRYPEVLEQAAENRAPHTLVQYLRELSAEFHSFYNSDKVIVADESLRNARLCLCTVVQTVLRNGFALIGISAPESM